MTLDTAETTVVEPREPAVATPPACGGPTAGGLAAAAVRATADPARAVAMRDTWRALWVSRLLVWVAGVGAVATFGLVAKRAAFDPPHVTSGFGWLGDLLAAPAARWDAAWYLVIAHYGYSPELCARRAARSAFFPLYPLGIRGISALGVPPVLAGVLLSLRRARARALRHPPPHDARSALG